VANTITEVLPKMLAQGLLALRENAVMPRLVNRDLENIAAQKGNVINVPIPSAIAARDITAAEAMNSNVDSAPTVALVTLDFWKEAPFHLSDKDVLSVMEGTVPMQASEAIKSLGNAIDAYILGKHTGIFGAVGTPGTTPFATLISAAADARKLLNKQLAPMNDRRGVLDPDAESNFLQLSNVLQTDQRGDQGGIVAGSIGTKLGIDWYMDQNVTSFTPGTAMTTASAAWTNNASIAAGATSADFIASNSGTLKVGDIFYFATGVVGGYVVTAATTMVTSTTLAISFYPPARQAYSANSTVTIGGAAGTAYVVNLAFHRDAFAWASRPLLDIQGLGNALISASDPITGVALRLEVSRQYKQTTFSYDVLGGANLVRRELAVKIRG
jgi:hypothetical protein